MDPQIQQFYYTKAVVPPTTRKNVEGTHSPLWFLLSLTSVGREIKRTVFYDRRLPLYYAIVGETKSITSRLSKLLEECNQIIYRFIPLIHPRFVITHFML